MGLRNPNKNDLEYTNNSDYTVIPTLTKVCGLNSADRYAILEEF
jgi:hypothetical protein